eukprot:GEMP01053537.1.p1 GENE.GEMP01053537.1~~GEMP01053537.1.p1  ORF type:complete len:392 (+),score=70.93 GEMP01053537.1:50-1225(+)
MFTAVWLTGSFALTLLYRQLIYLRLGKIIKFDFLNLPPDFPPDFPQKARESLEVSPLLKVVSMMAPVSVVISAIFTVHHVWTHHRKIRKIENNMEGRPALEIRNRCHPHDLCIQVVLLPLVYSLMAFKSVARMWMLMTGTVFESYDEFLRMRALEMQFYESNYYVADLYEAWALWCFSRLCVGTVRNKCVTDHWGKNARQLFLPLKEITLLGVESFVVTYAITAIYQLTISVFDGWGINVCANYPTVCAFQSYTSGAGFLASCLALYNIIAFERYLKPYLHDFSPTLKFWGAKILVSLAFVQTLVLKIVFVDLLQYFSTTQQNLFYSSLICIECVFVTGVHMKAWSADATWFADDSWRISLDKLMTPRTDERFGQRDEAKARPLLDDDDDA